MSTVDSLADVITAITTGLATLTGLSSAVSDNDKRVLNKETSLFVYGDGSGRQAIASTDGPYLFQQLHRVTVELQEKNTGSVQRLYDDTQTHIEAILAWFRANDTLSDDSGHVATCHAEPIDWRSTDQRDEAGGITYRRTVFTVSCLLVGITVS